MSTDLQICGWRVSSEIPLMGFAPWTGEDREPDVHIEHGHVATDFIVDREKIALETRSAKLCRFYVPQAAAFEIRNGSRIVVQPEPGASRGDIQTCLTGTLLGLLTLLRNLLPLHASSVRMGQSAVCFTGHSGAGKSTLAAALACRGHALLSDDVCAIDLSGPKGPVVLPSGSAVRLLECHEPAQKTWLPEGDRLGNDRVKQHVRFTMAETQPIPVSTIYRLEKLHGNGLLSIGEMRGSESVIAIYRNIFRYELAQELGLAASLFTKTARLCSSARIGVLSRRFELNSLDETVAQLEALHCGPATHRGTVYLPQAAE